MHINHISMSYGLQTIFDDVTIQIKENTKVGIVGVNGAGKSTLFKIILGTLEPTGGNIILKKGTRIGFLPQVIQDEIPSMDISVFDYLLSGRPIQELEHELEELYCLSSQEQDEKKLNTLLKKIGNTQEKLEYYEVYEAESILLKIISGMHFDNDLLGKKLSELSGGQKSKVAFARLLYSKPEIMMLDEPTNHLDTDTKQYIIDYLKTYKGTVLVISHDIAFLESVTEETLYLDKTTHKMELFPGSYKKYEKIRAERRLTQERIYARQVEEEEKLKKIIAKYIRGNEKKANIAKDRQKKLEKLEKNKVILEKKKKTTHFKIQVKEVSGITPITLKDVTFAYPNSPVLYEHLHFDLMRGEKFLIVGENGVGKSTLLKLIMGALKPLSGEIILNDKVSIGYYAQEHEGLKNDKTILENFKEFNMSIGALRAYLGNFLFYEEDVFKRISYLSPGERSRVSLARLALMGANVLVCRAWHIARW